MLKDKLNIIVDSVQYTGSEVWILVLLIGLVVIDLILKKNHFRILSLFFGAGLLVNFYLIASAPVADDLFLGALRITETTFYYKALVTLAALVLVAFRWLGKDEVGAAKAERGLSLSGEGEFFTLVAGMVLGMQFLVMSSNLLMLFISIELVSMPSYLLTLFRASKDAAEAAAKYLLFGALSTGIMLYGISWAYGLTGSLSVNDLPLLLEVGNMQMAGHIALVLLLAGILFKLSAVPFHIWAPDVYQGAPTSVVAFISVAPKVAAVGFMAQVLTNVPLLNNEYVTNAILLLATVSIFWGNLSALWQTSSKRMLAYSTIAHAGFLMVGLAVVNGMGELSLMYYLLVYLFANYAIFFYIDMVEESSGSDKFDRFAGLGRSSTILGAMVVVVMISLTGLPPTAGFTGKLFIFVALWNGFETAGNNWMIAVLVLGLVNTAIALYFYLKMPYMMYFRESKGEVTIKWTIARKTFFIVLALPLLILFFAPWLVTG
ncbi:NADH-quinone oxidoreductase subunit N [Limibacter armeniacum]|uniref:NADH-quinone oxidoreductase subunit N n=1 Tax=Limibacter armeniacum TaxID=466084 RepID=UPI002FE60689